MQDIEPWLCQEHFVSLTKSDILHKTTKHREGSTHVTRAAFFRQTMPK